MRLFADYQAPIVEALAVLEDSSIAQFPIDLHTIQKQYKHLFTIRSYGSLLKSEGLSRTKCFQYFGSEDGAAVSQGSRYIIFYNELKWKQRIRFTIAHEMGHIFLNHHRESGIPILMAGGVGDDQYHRLEHEADCFARNLICPAYHTNKLLGSHGITRLLNGNDEWVRTKETPITENLNTMFQAESLIEIAFDVSASAAKTRVGLLKADMNKYCSNKIDWKSTSQIQLVATWYCSRCGRQKLPSSTYCLECGKQHFVYKVPNERI